MAPERPHYEIEVPGCDSEGCDRTSVIMVPDGYYCAECYHRRLKETDTQVRKRSVAVPPPSNPWKRTEP